MTLWNTFYKIPHSAAICKEESVNWEAVFPNRVVIEGDWNEDGMVTDGDAVYLLGHTLFPEAYPFYPKA